MFKPIIPFKEGFHKRGFPRSTTGSCYFGFYDKENIGHEVKADYCEFSGSDTVVFFKDDVEGTPNQNFTIVAKEVARVKIEDINYLHEIDTRA